MRVLPQPPSPCSLNSPWPQDAKARGTLHAALDVAVAAAPEIEPLLWVWAVRLGRIDLLQRWRRQGVLPAADVLEQARWPGIDGPETPLILEAASQATPACLRCLMKMGLSPHVLSAQGRTALFVVRSRAVLRFLLKSGLSPATRDQTGLDAPGYWGVRAIKVNGFCPTDHARLVGVWPADPIQPADANARLAVATCLPHQVLRRELGRWQGCPSHESVAQVLALHMLGSESEDDPSSHHRRRLAHALTPAFNPDVELSPDERGCGAVVALGAAACKLNQERTGKASWRRLVGWVLDHLEPQATLEGAIAAHVPDPKGLVLRLRWSIWAQAQRGIHARGALGQGDRAQAERARSSWAHWGAQGFWEQACTKEGAQWSGPMGAGWTWADWCRQTTQTASARVVVPGDPWMATVWAWAAHVRDPIRLIRFVAHLQRRGASFDWPVALRPPGWQARLAECRGILPPQCVALLDRLMFEGDLPPAQDPGQRRSRL